MTKFRDLIRGLKRSGKILKRSGRSPAIERHYGDFGWALDKLKEGLCVVRAGWNGKGMWICLHEGEVARRSAVNVTAKGEPREFSRVLMSSSYIFMRTAQGDFVPWVASQMDLLSEDWCLVD
jgi:hypothetical protein